MHTECAQKLANVEDQLEAAQDINETALLHALRGPTRAVEAIENLQSSLRNVYCALNNAFKPIAVGRMPAPFLPLPEMPPEVCTQEGFTDYCSAAKIKVRSLAAMIKCRSALFAKRLERIFADPNEACVAVSPEAQNNDNVANSEQASTFFVRCTSEKIIRTLLHALEQTEAYLSFLRASEKGSKVEGFDAHGMALCAQHRPLMPSRFRQLAKTDLFCPDQDNLALLSAIEEHLQPVYVPRGNTLILAGTVGDGMYFVESGACQVAVGGSVRGCRCSASFSGRSRCCTRPSAWRM
jgi:hypothetical protein